MENRMNHGRVPTGTKFQRWSFHAPNSIQISSTLCFIKSGLNDHSSWSCMISACIDSCFGRRRTLRTSSCCRWLMANVDQGGITRVAPSCPAMTQVNNIKSLRLRINYSRMSTNITVPGGGTGSDKVKEQLGTSWITHVRKTTPFNISLCEVSNRFRTRELRNDNISPANKFPRSKTIVFWQSAHTKMSRGVVFVRWSHDVYIRLDASFSEVIWATDSSALDDVHLVAAQLNGGKAQGRKFPCKKIDVSLKKSDS